MMPAFAQYVQIVATLRHEPAPKTKVVAPASTHCSRGHERNEANAYRDPNGKLRCRACNREDWHRTGRGKGRRRGAGRESSLDFDDFEQVKEALPLASERAGAAS